MSAAPRSSPLFFQHLITFVIILAGVIGSIASYRTLRQEEYERAEAQFVRRTSVQHALSREVLRRYEDALYGLSLFFTVDANVTRLEFERAAARLEQRLIGAHVFEWVPIVMHENRAALEASMQRSTGRDFSIVHFDAAGRPLRAPDRPVYYPICFIHPLRGNEIALGFDLQTGPSREFLEKACETRQMLVTHQLRLVQEPGDRLGVIMIWPIYRVPRAPAASAAGSTPATTSTPPTTVTNTVPPPSSAPTTSPAAPTAPPAEVFSGFLQCVFRVHELLETASTAQPDTVVDMLFVDDSETDPTKRVLYYRPAADASAPSPVPNEAAIRSVMHREHEILFGQRHWRILYRPREGWLESQLTPRPFTRGCGIMLVASLLAGLIQIVSRQTTTIQRQVEERTAELAESRRQFATLLHALPGMAFRCSYDQKMTVLFVSEGALTLTGWTGDDFVSGTVHFRDIIHPDDLSRVRETTREALQDQKDVEIEYRIRARDGTEKWVLSRGRGLFDVNHRSLFEGLAIDITAQKNTEVARLTLERKLLEGQKLESLGLLAGGIAHDFNNLLSSILGNASMARLSLPPDSTAERQLRAIENGSLRAAELCRQMLAYAGKGRFIVEPTDLTTLTEDLLPLLRISIARQATLDLRLARDLPPVMADATQLRQIVMNLVLNAADAIAAQPHQNGDITISTGMLHANAATLSGSITGGGLPEGDYVFFEVRDSGCGMSADVLPKIFDPFFTTKFAGRGLGLAAVLGIVRGHDGALQVESTPGRGSTFRLLLPPAKNVALTKTTNPAEADQTTPWRRSGTVLVVEDEEHVRSMTVEVLKTFGFTVQDAANGTEGISRFRENPAVFDLVVLDLLMPGLNGEQTLSGLRLIKPDVRVLLVSGYHEGNLLNRLAHQGSIAFLSKPFTRDALEKKLRELLG